MSSSSLGFPRSPLEPALLGPVGSRSKAFRAAHPLVGVFGHRDGRVPASDALCRAPFGGAPDSPPPPPRQRTTISSNQSAWPRRRAPSGSFRWPVKGAARRCLQSPRSTSTTGISQTPFQRSPRLPSRPTFLGNLAPLRARSAGLPWLRGSMRLSPIERPLRAIARPRVVYPDPRDPDTFCRRRVARTAGGAIFAKCT